MMKETGMKLIHRSSVIPTNSRLHFSEAEDPKKEGMKNEVTGVPFMIRWLQYHFLHHLGN